MGVALLDRCGMILLPSRWLEGVTVPVMDAIETVLQITFVLSVYACVPGIVRMRRMSNDQG